MKTNGHDISLVHGGDFHSFLKLPFQGQCLQKGFPLANCRLRPVQAIQLIDGAIQALDHRSEVVTLNDHHPNVQSELKM